MCVGVCVCCVCVCVCVRERERVNQWGRKGTKENPLSFLFNVVCVISPFKLLGFLERRGGRERGREREGLGRLFCYT